MNIFEIFFYYRSLEMVAKRMVNVFLHSNFIYKKTKTYKIERKLMDIAESLSDKVSIFYAIFNTLLKIIYIL